MSLIRLLYSLALVCTFTLHCAHSEEFYVSNVSQLNEAFKAVNSNKQADTIVIAVGEYQLTKRLVFKEPNTVFAGESGVAKDVVLKGKGMRKTARTDVLIDVSADNTTISGMTLQDAGNHLIQVRAEADVDNFTLTNCVLRDAYEQLLKVSGGRKEGVPYSNNGHVSHCLFEYSAGIGPQYYIGGIDAHRSHNWVIEHNIFKHIASPGKRVAEHAIHMWNDSKDNLVLNNIIINSDRGLGFGLGKAPAQNSGGLIKGNTFIHYGMGHPNADASIILESSPGTRVINNTVFQDHGYRNAIEYRFESTQGVLIQGNRVNKRIKSRNGGQAILVDNIHY